MATAPLISIKNVECTQILPHSTVAVPLKSGTMTLTEPLAGVPTEAKLFLTITPSPSEVSSIEDTTPLTVPIHPDLFVGSKSGLCQSFRFKISEELGTIEVAFPQGVPEEDALNFEKIMVYNGFLKTGIVAEADNVAKKIAETASNVASYLSMKTDDRNEQAPLADKDHEFSDITKEIIGGAEDGTGKMTEGAANVGNAITDAVYNAGAWIGEKTGVKGGANGTDNASKPTPPPSDDPQQEKSLARETLDQTLEGGAIVGKQMGSGIKMVGSEIGESASKVAQHDYGSDAKKLVDSTRQTGANIGNTAKDLVIGTSVVINAGTAGVGATKDDQEKPGEKPEEKPEKNDKV
ncbi:hypothetical protein Dda_0732 [Drechslerella dactyloides]|uniref:Senescence domain-containing protein n=1 Tax=Drechslerella dactyloides TaxID=74499 RepID=A0AAD6J536_DREDA|nr:hypothetical protein Dda_0732 [Drechslerella dactyloides]